MEIKQVHDEAECSWCQKPKECAEVELANGTTVLLCFADLRKMAKMTLNKPAQKAKV